MAISRGGERPSGEGACLGLPRPTLRPASLSRGDAVPRRAGQGNHNQSFSTRGGCPIETLSIPSAAPAALCGSVLPLEKGLRQGGSRAKRGWGSTPCGTGFLGRGAAGGETQRAHRAGRSAEVSLRRMLGHGPLGNAGWFWRPCAGPARGVRRTEYSPRSRHPPLGGGLLLRAGRARSVVRRLENGPLREGAPERSEGGGVLRAGRGSSGGARPGVKHRGHTEPAGAPEGGAGGARQTGREGRGGREGREGLGQSGLVGLPGKHGSLQVRMHCKPVLPRVGAAFAVIPVRRKKKSEKTSCAWGRECAILPLKQTEFAREGGSKPKKNKPRKQTT